MKAKQLQSLGMVGLVSVALVLTGCTWNKRSLAARKKQQASTMKLELETLRRDNAALRKEAGENRAQLELLQSELTRTREEQKRFQQTMRTNFDLMEQSVALSLSKAITADMRNNSAPAAPAAQPKADQTALVTNSQAKSGQVPAAPETSGPVAQRAAPARPAVAASPPVVAPVAMTAPQAPVNPPAGVEPFNDPDLLPPAQPRMLKAHPEAKPLYEKGFSLFARKEYGQSILVFKNFLNRFPDDIYSDNAQFWIGEAHLRMKQPREAEAAYRQVLRDYEHRSTLEGYKTPDAMYRIGQAYQQRKDDATARHYFRAITERFPETSAGRKASRALSMGSLKTASTN